MGISGPVLLFSADDPSIYVQTLFLSLLETGR